MPSKRRDVKRKLRRMSAEGRGRGAQRRKANRERQTADKARKDAAKDAHRAEMLRRQERAR